MSLDSYWFSPNKVDLQVHPGIEMIQPQHPYGRYSIEAMKLKSQEANTKNAPWSHIYYL